MFDLDPGKLIVIGVVALIAIPSKDLPRVLRTLGQYSGRMRRMAAEFQEQFMEALRESELENIKKDIEHTSESLKEAVDLGGSFDPIKDMRNHLTQTIEGTIPEETRKSLSKTGESKSLGESE